jgi:hypothetical protein
VTTPNRAVSPLAHALLLALVLATVAYWAPWVQHAAAALRLSGQDLGEFVKFIPAIRRGETSFPRQLFYVPPLVMTVILVALSVNQELPYRRWLRIATLVYAVALLPGLLPPAWGHPREMLSPEFRLQGIGLLLGATIAATHGLFRRLPLRSLAVLILVLALLALIAPHGAFWAIRSRIWAAYDASGLRLGWGLWLHVAAWLGVAACAAAWLI